MEQETATAETWSPKRGAFLVWMAGSAAAAFIGMFLLISLTLQAGRTPLPFEVLLERQRAKLADDLGNIVFVGDSSLGNAVDAQLFSRLSGAKAANLALTAGYGYQGTLRMVEAVLKRHHPSDIVIVQTPEVMMRRPDPADFDLAPASTLSPVGRFRRRWLDTMNLDQLEEAVRYVLFSSDRRADERRGQIFRDDYIAQRDKPANLPPASHFDVRKINAGNGAVLAKIAGICQKAEVNCVYLHGPWADPVCHRISGYLAAVDQIVRQSGLILADGEAECLAPDEVGDQADHTAPAAKDKMTRRIFERLRPYLSRKQPSGSVLTSDRGYELVRP
jgi:hypothetical protein